VNEQTSRQLTLLRQIRDAFSSSAIGWWIFGGWGLDTRIGRVTRDHGDIEFWVERTDGDPVRDLLFELGAFDLANQPPEESREFSRDDGLIFSSAFFDRHQDGTCRTQGRWSDWILPVGSFDGPVGRIDDLELPAMSVAGMLSMKLQYGSLRNGAPMREKDQRDVEVLRRLLA
jgi:lincosamide nucleotidyltransferase A/C/D/E